MNKIKKVFAVLLTAAAVIPACTSVSAAVSGSGTKDDPYLVSSISDMKNCVKNSCYIKLDNNMTFSESNYIDIAGVDVHLDLNGHTFENTSESSLYAATPPEIFKVYDYGSFTLDDSVGGGQIIGNRNNAVISATGIIRPNGTSRGSIVINGGTVINNNTTMGQNDTAFRSYAISVGTTSDAVINGGTFLSKNSDSVSVNGLAEINGGTFNFTYPHYGLNLFGNSKKTVNGGEIKNLNIYVGSYAPFDVRINKCDIYRAVSVPSNYTLADFLSPYTTAEYNGSAVDTNVQKYTCPSANTPLVIRTPQAAVTYDADGGSGEMPSEKVFKGGSLTLPECAFTKEGMNFAHWLINGTEYNAGGHVENITDDIVVKAVWELPQLVVGGVEVTAANADNILGDGNFVYNGTDLTLSIYGSAEFENCDALICNNGIDDLQIEIMGDSVLSSSTDYTYGIYAGKRTVISGDKKLTIDGIGGKGKGQYAVYAEDSLYMKNITVKAELSGQKAGIFAKNKKATFYKAWVEAKNASAEYSAIYTQDTAPQYTGTDIVLPENAVIKTNDASGMTIYNSDGSTPASTVLLRVKFEAKFEANGGAGDMDSGTIYLGDTYTVPDCAFTAPEGKQFKCWEYAGNDTAPGEEIAVTDHITLTAQWETRVCKVTYMTYRDEIILTQEVLYGEKADTSVLPDDCRDGFITGWYAEDEYVTQFDFDTPIIDDMVIYAGVKQQEWSYTLNANQNGQTYRAYYGDGLGISCDPTYGIIKWELWDGDKLLIEEPAVSGAVPSSGLYIPPKTVAAEKAADLRYQYKRYGTTQTAVHKVIFIYKRGDMNGDGDITQEDAALYLKHINGAQAFTAEQLKRADVNYDGKNNILDAVEIMLNII